MAALTALWIALTPLTNEASPVALGLGNEQLIQTETSCGNFCLNASNANFDITASAHASVAVIPQQFSNSSGEGLKLSPTQIKTYDLSWHPKYNLSAAAGFRTSERSTERANSGRTVRRITASTMEIPLSVSARPLDTVSLGLRYVLREVNLKQENLINPVARTATMMTQPHRWAVDAVWQKNDQTGFGISYVAPTATSMSAETTANPTATPSHLTPKWSDPQEVTASMAHYTSLKPPDGIVFGPFENIFHTSLSVATWEKGTPVAYSALASGSVSKEGWSLTDEGKQTQEFNFNKLDPNISASAGLESLWLRKSFGTVSTYTHIRINHIATQSELNQWQGGFGLSISGPYLTLRGSSLWRDSESGYAFGLSASL